MSVGARPPLWPPLRHKERLGGSPRFQFHSAPAHLAASMATRRAQRNTRAAVRRARARTFSDMPPNAVPDQNRYGVTRVDYIDTFNVALPRKNSLAHNLSVNSTTDGSERVRKPLSPPPTHPLPPHAAPPPSPAERGMREESNGRCGTNSMMLS